MKVVCLGGGGAMPKALLSELKKESNIELTVVSSVLDSGGSSGRLREDLNIIAPGDIRRSLLELSSLDNETKKVLDYRFKEGNLKGHNLANLIIASYFLKDDDFSKKINDLNNFFKTQHKVLPATDSEAHLCAKLKSGEIVKGETNIDIPKHSSEIDEVFLDKEVEIFKEAEKDIENADIIIIGPGDLYSSLIQILLVRGMKDAIKKSSAKKIYVCNIMTKRGETDDFSVKDFALEIEKYLETKLDYIIFNNNLAANTKDKQESLVDLVKFDDYNDSRYIGRDLLKENGVEHDPQKLVKSINELI